MINAPLNIGCIFCTLHTIVQARILNEWEYRISHSKEDGIIIRVIIV